MSHPLDLVLLDVPWETEGAYEIGVNLLQELFRIARLLGVDELGHVMDSPGQWPQWQFHEGQRAASWRARVLEWIARCIVLSFIWEKQSFHHSTNEDSFSAP
jgi:hypothetical protein